MDCWLQYLGVVPKGPLDTGVALQPHHYLQIKLSKKALLWLKMDHTVYI